MTKANITITDHQFQALIKLSQLTEIEPTFKEIIRLMEDGTITINTARSGREVVWYFNPETWTECAIYTDTLEELPYKDIFQELTDEEED